MKRTLIALAVAALPLLSLLTMSPKAPTAVPWWTWVATT